MFNNQKRRHITCS